MCVIVAWRLAWAGGWLGAKEADESLNMAETERVGFVVQGQDYLQQSYNLPSLRWSCRGMMTMGVP